MPPMKMVLAAVVALASVAAAQDREREIYRRLQPYPQVEILATNNRGVSVFVRDRTSRVLGTFTPAEVRAWLDGPVEKYVPAEILFALNTKAAPKERLTEYSAMLGMSTTVQLTRVAGTKIMDGYSMVISGERGFETIRIPLTKPELRKVLDGFRSAASVTDSMTPPTLPVPVQKAEEALYDFQVETPATASRANTPPAYPKTLRAANIEGQVVAKFIVDTTGRIEAGSLEIVRSDHELFSAAVRDALPLMRFEPARVGARKVRQLVQFPFTFSLTRE